MEPQDNVREKSNVKQQLIFVIAIASIIGNIVLAWLLTQKQTEYVTEVQKVEELSDDKVRLEFELKEMLAQYDSLQTNNDSIMTVLADEKSRVEDLLKKLKNNSWTIAKLKKETETLRKIMKGFVQTIDSLNTANLELKAENQQIRGELGQERDKAKSLSEEKQQLAEKVKIGEKLQAVYIEAYAQIVKSNTVHKKTDRARRAEKIKCCFTLNTNELTKHGNKNTYIRIIAPSGKVLTDKEDRSNMFEFDGVRGLYSVKKEINYEGKNLDVCLDWDVNTELEVGKYVVYAYCEDYEVGATEFVLK
jgi:regulator of replication initiation timing